MTTDIDERLRDLGIELPRVLPPAGNYVPVVRTGALLYTSGAGPVRPDGSMVTGKVGTDIDLEAGVEAARLTGLQLLAALAAECGSLNSIKRIVKIFGMVNCAPGFRSTPAVINGFTDLILEIFGREVGAHARSAIGVAELPFNLPVEIEGEVELRPR